MNELRRTIEDALSAAPPDSDTRELVGKALDMLDTIPMEPLEIMAKVERVKERVTALLEEYTKHSSPFNAWMEKGVVRRVLSEIAEEFPDAKE